MRDVYKRQLFGLRVITRLEGNVIMSEGLVLQDVDVWYDSTKIHTTPHNNMTCLLYTSPAHCFPVLLYGSLFFGHSVHRQNWLRLYPLWLSLIHI